MARWVASLTEKEAKLCDMLMVEYVRTHLNKYDIAFQEIIENFLIDEGYENHEQIMIGFTNLMEDSGKKIMKLENEGERYYMSLNKDKAQIIKDYQEELNKGVGEGEALKTVVMKYGKYSKSSIKNVVKSVIKQNKVMGNCASTTCPNKLENGNCGNDVVTEGRNTCQNYKPREVKEETVSKREQCFKFFEDNKTLDKAEMVKQAAEKFGMKEDTVRRYLYNWLKTQEETQKESKIESKTDKEPTKTDEGTDKENVGKFKIKEKVIQKTIKLVEGEFGEYSIEDKIVSINGYKYKDIEKVKNYTEEYKEASEAEISRLQDEFHEEVIRLKKRLEEEINIINQRIEKADAQQKELIEVLEMAHKGEF